MRLKKSDIGMLGEKVASAAEAVARAGKDLDKDLAGETDLGTDDVFLHRLQTLRDSVSALEKLSGEILSSLGVQPSSADSTGYRPKFEDFLMEVGGAVLSAQRRLDHASEQYLEETQSDTHVLPSIFRVPKLSASMKFAIERDDQRGLNLVFFSKASEARELHQQSIDFEIVSVPAPLEVLRKLAAPQPEPADRNR